MKARLMRKSGIVLAATALLIAATAGKSLAGFERKASSAALRQATVAAPLGAPRGYKVVTTGPFDAPGGQQTQGVATCPGTEVPAGGGALISPVGTNDVPLYSSLNSSYPQRNFWVVDVNTVSGSDASFNVYVICISAATSYSVVSSALTSNPAGSVTSISASCPTNRVIVGGGAFSTSTNVGVNISSDFPQTSTTWRIDMANGSAASTTAAAYAVCRAKPTGYSIPFSIQSAPRGAESPGAIACPTGSLPLSGGLFTGAVLSLNLNSSFPSASDWVSFLNDGDNSNNFWPFEVFAVCAGT